MQSVTYLTARGLVMKMTADTQAGCSQVGQCCRRLHAIVAMWLKTVGTGVYYVTTSAYLTGATYLAQLALDLLVSGPP